MANITFTNGRGIWTITAGGASTLPYLLCNYDLIPKRLRYIPSTTSAAGDRVVIQDSEGVEIYSEIAGGPSADPVEQRPRAHEQWMGTAVSGHNSGITITQFDSGTLEIHY